LRRITTDVRDGMSAVGESGRRIPLGHSNADRRKSRCWPGVTRRKLQHDPRRTSAMARTSASGAKFHHVGHRCPA